MRLVDMVRAGRVGKPANTVPSLSDKVAWEGFLDVMRAGLDGGAPALVIDNVADTAETHERWDVADFPNAAPPWSEAWYEFRLPERLFDYLQVPAVGLWVVALPREAEDAEGGWDLTGFPFTEVPHKNEVIGPMPPLRATLGADGSVESWEAAPVPGVTDANDMGLLGLFIPVLLANSFAQCKNVSEEVVHAPERQSKRHKRKYGQPLSRYRVLAIDPMREVLRTEGRSDEVGIRQALHICRGHFKTYDKKPLFGKLTGTYFWADHVRGDPRRGRVVKDYEVSLPGDDGSIEVTVGPRTTGTPPARASDPAYRQAIERFSVDVALQRLAVEYPGKSIEEQGHSHPGYDIEVSEGATVVRYVEVKGTSRDIPAFSFSENERRFSFDNADRYSIVIVYDIDLEQRTYEVRTEDGAIDERFQLRPTQWEGVAPATG